MRLGSRTQAAFALTLALGGARAGADTITLKNGRVIQADRAWFDGSQLFYEKDGAVFGLPRDLVRALERAPTAASEQDRDIGRAREKLLAGEAAEAVRLLRAVLGRDPRSVAALQALAEAQLRLRDVRGARESAEKALRLDDHDPRSHALLGDALAAAGDAQAAAASYRDSLKLRPDVAVERRLQEVAPAPGRASSGAQLRLRYDGGVNEPLGMAVLQSLSDAWLEYERRLGFAPHDPVTVILQTEADFQDTRAPGWAQGWNDGEIRISVRGLDALQPRLVAVLRHELAHSFVASQTAGNCPTWLQEGIAQWLEGGDPGREDAGLAKRARDGRLLSLLSLEAPFQSLPAEDAALAYAESLSGVAHILRIREQAGLVRLISALADGLPSEEALPVAIGLSYAELQRSWEDHLR